MFVYLPESSQASKEVTLLCFPAGTQHCWGGQQSVQAAPELTVHFRDMFCDLFVLTPWFKVAELSLAEIAVVMGIGRAGQKRGLEIVFLLLISRECD